ncbi:MAG: aspartate dehydrogenase [Butyrivibrio sp.]|nr:aspartate dehydrogenase [Butyrivibrio sp.]
MFFRKKDKQIQKKSYDSANQKPVIKCSICNGEQVAGFQDVHTGSFEEVMLIRNSEDLFVFKSQYGIEGDISKIY